MKITALIVTTLFTLLLAGPASAAVDRGDRGSGVAATQQALRNHGVSPGPVDGVFGPQTHRAVVNFQRKRGLVVDGIVGPQTARALGIAVPHPGGTTRTTTRPAATSAGGCARVYQSYINVGAPAGVANWFAYTVSPRESGCTPVFVHDADDWSYSVVGNNGITADLRAGWLRLCGRDVRVWEGWEADAACGWAAYQVLGRGPWS